VALPRSFHFFNVLLGIVEIPWLQAKRSFVMPAQTGIQVCFGEAQRAAWIPASAGMTEKRAATLSRGLFNFTFAVLP
jgi:hypothetical protein